MKLTEPSEDVADRPKAWLPTKLKFEITKEFANSSGRLPRAIQRCGESQLKTKIAFMSGDTALTAALLMAHMKRASFSLQLLRPNGGLSFHFFTLGHCVHCLVS